MRSGFQEVALVKPSYLKLWKIEEAFNVTEVRQWMGKHFVDICVLSSLIYLILIFVGKAWMKNRKPYDLRTSLILWNCGLSLFSITTFFRVSPELIYILANFGVHHSLCKKDNHNPATALWGWLFVIAKIFEFGDTAFIILRKTPLIFLHWFHHVTVNLYSWYFYETYTSTYRWFGSINSFIHAVMYAYYAIVASGQKWPRKFSSLITLLQLSQMVVGVTITLYLLYLYAFVENNQCEIDISSVYWGLGMYGAYFLLFANFFIKAYMKKPKQVKKD